MARLNLVDLPPESPNGPQRRIGLGVLEHVVKHSQHATSAAVESEVSERQVTLAAAETLRNRGAFVEGPEAAKRQLGGHGSARGFTGALLQFACGTNTERAGTEPAKTSRVNW
jgi:hypothetical protein